MPYLIAFILAISVASCDFTDMSFAQKPFTQIAIFDGAGAELQTTSPRNCYPPDVSNPSEYFMDGAGGRTKIKAGTVFTCDLADMDDITTLLEQFTITNGVSSETVNIVAFAAGRALQWYEDTPIEIRQGSLQYDSARLEFFSGKLAPSVYVDSDLIRYKAWGTIDAALTPDAPTGWNSGVVGTGTSTFDDMTFAAGVLTVTKQVTTAPSNSDIMVLYADIPIGANTGPNITFGLTFNALPSNADQILLYAEERDIGGSAVGAASTTVVSSTGAKTVTHTIAQADVYSLRVGVSWTYSNGDHASEVTTLALPLVTYTL